MDFNDTPQEAEFRAKCRAWLEANAELKTKKTNSAKNMNIGNKSLLEAAAEWQKKKYDAGWAMIHWPKEFGGIGATPIERIIWAQEESKFNVPKGVYEIGLGMAGPVMMEYATDEQKERYLPPMAEGKEIWCQLFSEPSAGSDVAGLRSKAVQDGENWIVNGQKVWTSGAHFSDFGILVVRHDPGLEKHKGLTFFFVDMKSPGIEVKPIKQLTGGSSFNEVYFNDVVIPDSQRLGEIGDGWKVAITTLMNERLAVGDADGVDANEAFELAKKHDKGGEQLIDNNAVRESIADWYCEASGLKNTKLRTMSADIVLSFVFLSPDASQYQSAIDSLTALLSMSCSPPLSCFFASSKASLASTPSASPTASLSFIRVVIATFHPSPISPSLCESGITTSLK